MPRGYFLWQSILRNRKKPLFGPAINRAHFLEEKVAKFPRIIIDKEIAAEVITLNDERIKESVSPEIAQLNEILGGNIVLMDDDGQYYLNYLNTLSQGINFADWLIIHDLWSKLLPEEVRKQKEKIANLNEQVKSSDNEENRKQLQYKIERCYRIIAKYDWLRNYLCNSRPGQSHRSFE